MPKLILAVVGALLLISGIANDPRTAWPYWVIWAGTTALYLLLIRSGDYLERALLVFCWFVAIVAISQVVGYCAGVRDAGFVPWRPSSFVNSSNILGEIMVWGMILAWKNNRRWSVGLFLSILIMSGSRTSYLAAFAVIVVYVCNKNLFLLQILPPLVCGVSSILYFGSVLLGRMDIMSRVSPWIGAADIGGGIVGRGPGYLQEHLPAVTLHHNWHAHNVLLQAWGDLGAAGAISVIVLLVAIIRSATCKSSSSVWLWMFLAANITAGVLEYLYWLPGIGLLALLFYNRLSIEKSCTPAPVYADGISGIASQVR